MEKVNSNILAAFMRVSLKTSSKKDKVLKGFPMETNSQEFIIKESPMERGSTNGVTALTMKAHSKMVLDKVQENGTKMKTLFMRENFIRIKNMARELSITKMEAF